MGRAVGPWFAGTCGRPANGSVLLVKLVQVLAQQLHQLHAQRAVLAQVGEEVLSPQEGDVARLNRFRRRVVGAAGHGFSQTQHGAGAGHVQRQAAFSQPQPRPAFLDEKDSAHRPSATVYRRARAVVPHLGGAFKNAQQVGLNRSQIMVQQGSHPAKSGVEKYRRQGKPTVTYITVEGDGFAPWVSAARVGLSVANIPAGIDLTFESHPVYTGRSTTYRHTNARDLETTKEALCAACKRPLPQGGGPCAYCGRPPGSFQVRPLFLAVVLAISVAFGAVTVFAARFYRSKQLQLGGMWFGRGEAALATGDSRAAVQDFRNALYYSHDDPAYRLRLAEALVAAHHIQEAQSYLVTLWQDEPSNSTVNLQLARLAARQGETQAALRYYHGAIYGLWPDSDAAARRRQTRLELIHYLLGLRDATQAEAELIALTSELPRTAAAHSEAGQLLLQIGDAEHANQEFEEALRLNPRSPAALRGAGEAAFQLGQYQNASRYLEQALKSGPRDPEPAELLATTRQILEWDPNSQDVSSWHRALRIVQAFQQARRRLGDCSAAKGIDLAAASARQPSSPVPPNAPSASHEPAHNLMAQILGRIRGGGTATPEQVPIMLNPAEMQQLYQQAAQVQRRVRAYKLERDPQLAASVMDLVGRIETVTAQQCGAPQGADLALLLLAHRTEER